MVSSRNIKQRGPTVIDTRFNIPFGVIDLSHEVVDPVADPDDTLAEDSDTFDDESLEVVDIGGNDQDTTGTSSDFVYLPPTTVTVFSQVVRILADGSHVVDVTLDIPEDLGVDEYDVRLSKV